MDTDDGGQTTETREDWDLRGLKGRDGIGPDTRDAMRTILLLHLLGMLGVLRAGEGGGVVVWNLVEMAGRLQGTAQIEVLGQPRFAADLEGRAAVVFDGVDDGLILERSELAGATRFTVEVLFLPQASGPEKQRFFHAGQVEGDRILLETRMPLPDAWCLDSFVRRGDAELVLIDRALVHPVGRWTWVALVYDGRKLVSFVDGVKELEGTIEGVVAPAGRTALGVRQNRVSWYKGGIAEVRFHREALGPERLQRVAP